MNKKKLYEQLSNKQKNHIMASLTVIFFKLLKKCLK